MLVDKEKNNAQARRYNNGSTRTNIFKVGENKSGHGKYNAKNNCNDAGLQVRAAHDKRASNRKRNERHNQQSTNHLACKCNGNSAKQGKYAVDKANLNSSQTCERKIDS